MSEFTKYDGGKPRMDLLPPHALEGVARVLTYGRQKYQAWNWVKAPDFSRYYAATQRHLSAWQRGEDTDPESGLPHLHHALCSLMFLAELQRLGTAEDDRPTDDQLRAQVAAARDSGPEVGGKPLAEWDLFCRVHGLYEGNTRGCPRCEDGDL